MRRASRSPWQHARYPRRMSPSSREQKRGPCLLDEFGGRRATNMAAVVLAQVTSAAHMAMQQFVRGHYTQGLPHTPMSGQPSPPSRTGGSTNPPSSTPSTSDYARACASRSPTSTPIASRAAPMAAATAHTAASWRPLQTCSRGATSSSATTAADTTTRQRSPSGAWSVPWMTPGATAPTVSDLSAPSRPFQTKPRSYQDTARRISRGPHNTQGNGHRIHLPGRRQPRAQGTREA